MKPHLIKLIALALVVALAGCGQNAATPAEKSEKPAVLTPVAPASAPK